MSRDSVWRSTIRRCWRRDRWSWPWPGGRPWRGRSTAHRIEEDCSVGSVGKDLQSPRIQWLVHVVSKPKLCNWSLSVPSGFIKLACIYLSRELCYREREREREREGGREAEGQRERGGGGRGRERERVSEWVREWVREREKELRGLRSRKGGAGDWEEGLSRERVRIWHLLQFLLFTVISMQNFVFFRKSMRREDLTEILVMCLNFSFCRSAENATSLHMLVLFFSHWLLVSFSVDCFSTYDGPTTWWLPSQLSSSSARLGLVDLVHPLVSSVAYWHRILGIHN